MRLLFAGGVCCAALAFVDGAVLLVPAGAGVVAGLLAGALLASGAGDGLLAGAEFAAGADAVDSAAVVFLDRLCLVVVASALAGGAPPAAAELSAVSAVALFFERDFAESPLFAEEPAATVLLSVASGAVLFLERDFFGAVAVELEAAASVLSGAFFLDLEVVLLVESAVASGLVCELSLAAAFFLLFFLVVVLVSV